MASRLLLTHVLAACVIGLLVSCTFHIVLLALLYRSQSSLAMVPDWAPTLLSAFVGLSVPLWQSRANGMIISLIVVPAAMMLLSVLSVLAGCRLLGDCLWQGSEFGLSLSRFRGHLLWRRMRQGVHDGSTTSAHVCG